MGSGNAENIDYDDDDTVPGAVLCCAALCRAVLNCAVSRCVAMCCALLRCGSSRPWRPNPDRTDLKLKLELPERMPHTELVAVDTCGMLSQLEPKIRSNSEAGRTEKGRTRAPKATTPSQTTIKLRSQGHNPSLVTLHPRPQGHTSW